MTKIIFLFFSILLISGCSMPQNQEKKIPLTNERHGDIIQIDTPAPASYISSPLTITGKARGNWFFEAIFPVILTDWDGLIIGQGQAQAQGEWMTENFVPFKTTITFKEPVSSVSNRGALILKKNNPSGLPQNDDYLEIPIFFSK
jgi:hypothetical protein